MTAHEVLTQQVHQMVEDNTRMHLAGCELAAAALHIITYYDGTHRLALAVSKWMEAVANEGCREERKEEL